MNSVSYNPIKKLSGRDYFQFVTSFLMTILGAIILLRAFSSRVFVLPILVGAGFLFLGIYRLNFVYRYLKRRKKCHRFRFHL
ncbi:MAG TPA: hypothetical protein VMT04_00745 [Terriglobales bacterium]|nr:hypothetical protein [Terriglobales bacterium]